MNIQHTNHKGLYLLFSLLILALTSAFAIARDTQTIRVGGSAESIYDTRIADIEILISLLFNEMFKDQDKQLKIKIYDSDLLLSKQLVEGRLDAAFMNPVFFLNNIDHLNSQYTYAVQHGSTTKTKYVVLVRRDSGITSLAGLRNKKIIIPSGHRVGQRFLDVELMRDGLPDTEGIFSELRHTRETNAAIVNLFFGQVDAALVTDFSYQVACELNRQIPDALQIIRTSEPLIHMLVSVRKDFPPQIVESLLPFTKIFDNSPRLRYLQKTFLFEGVSKITAEDISDIQSLNREYVALKKQSLLQ
jgi:ABC-type phosphate/phosphonate transport system substrate-binding protein